MSQDQNTPTPCLDCDGAEIRVGDWVVHKDEPVGFGRYQVAQVMRGLDGKVALMFELCLGEYDPSRFRRLPPQPQPSAAQPEPGADAAGHVVAEPRLDDLLAMARGDDFRGPMLHLRSWVELDSLVSSLADEAEELQARNHALEVLLASANQTTNKLTRERDTALAAVEAGRTQAAADVLAERERQVGAEGWVAEHDDEHEDGELAAAAAVYAAPDGSDVAALWPWAIDDYKPSTRRRDLVKAAALLLAEIERLDRRAAPPTTPGPAP